MKLSPESLPGTEEGIGKRFVRQVRPLREVGHLLARTSPERDEREGRRGGLIQPGKLARDVLDGLSRSYRTGWPRRNRTKRCTFHRRQDTPRRGMPQPASPQDP